MEGPSRGVLLAAIGSVLISVFAALPSPDVIIRKSPTVADRRPGDVRRISMAAEGNGVLHAVLEVWTDSDWDIEYWSSIPALTPKARIVTNDGVEQRQTTLGIRDGVLGLAWVDYDQKRRLHTLKATMKPVRNRDWRTPWVIVEGSPEPITIFSAETARGITPLVHYRVGSKIYRWHALGTGHVSAANPPPAQVRPPGVPRDAAAFATFRDGLWLAFLRTRTAEAIYRTAEVRYTGRPGAFRGPATIPVVALAPQ